MAEGIDAADGDAATADKEIGGSGRQEPAATWFSNDNDCSIRLESRDKQGVHPVYYELRNQNAQEAWGIGMVKNTNLKIGYGTLGSMGDKDVAIEILQGTSKKLIFHQDVVFHRRPQFAGDGGMPDFTQKLKIGSTVALKGGRNHNNYYCADDGDRISCNRNAIGQWEKFKVFSGGPGKIALRGGKSNQFCADEGNRIRCNRKWIQGWEKFKIEDAGGGKIALRGGQRGRVCADETYNTKCNRGGIGQWEKFTVECLENCATEELLGESAVEHDDQSEEEEVTDEEEKVTDKAEAAMQALTAEETKAAAIEAMHEKERQTLHQKITNAKARRERAGIEFDHPEAANKEEAEHVKADVVLAKQQLRHTLKEALFSKGSMSEQQREQLVAQATSAKEQAEEHLSQVQGAKAQVSYDPLGKFKQAVQATEVVLGKAMQSDPLVVATVQQHTGMRAKKVPVKEEEVRHSDACTAKRLAVATATDDAVRTRLGRLKVQQQLRQQIAAKKVADLKQKKAMLQAKVQKQLEAGEFSSSSRGMSRALIRLKVQINRYSKLSKGNSVELAQLKAANKVLTTMITQLQQKLPADHQPSISFAQQLDFSKVSEASLSAESVCVTHSSRTLLSAEEELANLSSESIAKDDQSSIPSVFGKLGGLTLGASNEEDSQKIPSEMGKLANVKSITPNALQKNAEVAIQETSGEGLGQGRWGRRRRRRRRHNSRRRRRRRRRRFTGTLTKSTYSTNGIDPAVSYYSSDDDASIRVESRKSSDPEEVYLELRNQDNKNGWKVGMNDDYKLHMGWGPVGTMNQLTEALRLDPDSNLHFFGEVEFKGDVVKEYSPSGLTCIGGNRITGGPNRWSSWSTCPSGYSVVGLQEISMHNSLDSNRGKYQDIDHHQCRNKGCRAWCRSDKCDVTARCCKTEVSPLRCYTGQYKTQRRYRWGRPAYCHRAYTVTGFGNLDLHNNRYWKHQMVNDFYASNRYVRAWCWGSNCGVRPRCCKPRNKGQKLQCKAGTKAIGARDTWGPFSTCDDGWMPMTHQRIDLLDQRHPHNEVMHKYECNEKGCRAYCWGSACQTWAKCCRIVAQ